MTSKQTQYDQCKFRCRCSLPFEKKNWKKKLEWNVRVCCMIYIALDWQRLLIIPQRKIDSLGWLLCTQTWIVWTRYIPVQLICTYQISIHKNVDQSHIILCSLLPFFFHITVLIVNKTGGYSHPICHLSFVLFLNLMQTTTETKYEVTHVY